MTFFVCLFDVVVVNQQQIENQFDDDLHDVYFIDTDTRREWERERLRKHVQNEWIIHFRLRFENWYCACAIFIKILFWGKFLHKFLWILHHHQKFFQNQTNHQWMREIQCLASFIKSIDGDYLTLSFFSLPIMMMMMMMWWWLLTPSPSRRKKKY